MIVNTANEGRIMSGGEAIVAALIANGIDTLYGLPGAQMYPLFDALHGASERIRTIGARHEQACAYMAFGHARSTGRPGVFSVVPGPGALNTMAALCTAAGCNAPVLMITGQIPTPFIGRGRGHLHELPDQLATLRSVVKWATRIERPADAPRILNEAFRQMLSGRPGPVAVEMAWDAMAMCEHVRPLAPARPETPVPPLPEAIAEAVNRICEARNPMIMVGGGAQHAAAAVRALAQEIGAPVAALRSGRGIMPEDQPLGLSSYAAYRYWPQTDLLIGIGSRLEMPYMRWSGMGQLTDKPKGPPPLIRIDIDPAEMNRLKPDTAIVGDAEEVSDALLKALHNAGHQSRPIPDAVAAAKLSAATEISRVKPHVDYLHIIREALPLEGIFVEELCQAGFASYFAFPVLRPRSYISSGYQGTLGFGFMTALGAKAANPDRPVVSITGDGGFLFGIQELASAKQYGLGVVTIVFNNKAYGNVLRDQQTGYGGREIASRLENPDFLELARAFGIPGHRVTTPGELHRVLEAAIAADVPALIEVPVDPADEVSPWPFIHPNG
ncbi:thiamine pyrophosphate-dependent enzyme [Breoghania sp.]|uniref:thiamine pyrophosphate-dependent enzyme n=1 Tax=Breoghania sp. TaxID=2065378 RepID=UPI002AAC154C|nr:thiamine pyrophosphate-dependent enzyme [Breoghania sp.]